MHRSRARLARCADGALVDASLVHTLEAPTGRRFALLTTLRDRAVRLLNGDEVTARRGHAEHYLAVARVLTEDYFGPRSDTAYARLIAETDNLRSAVGWAIGAGDAELAARLLLAWRTTWKTPSLYAETRAAIARVLTLDGLSELSRTLVQVLDLGIAYQSGTANDADIGRSLVTGVAEVERLAPTHDLAIRGNCWIAAIRVMEPDGGDDARRFADRALELAAGAAPYLQETALDLAGYVAMHRGDPQRARELAEQSVELCRRRGDPLALAMGYITLGDALIEAGDAAAARQAAEVMLHFRTETDPSNGLPTRRTTCSAGSLCSRATDVRHTASCSHRLAPGGLLVGRGTFPTTSSSSPRPFTCSVTTKWQLGSSGQQGGSPPIMDSPSRHRRIRWASCCGLQRRRSESGAGGSCVTKAQRPVSRN